LSIRLVSSRQSLAVESPVSWLKVCSGSEFYDPRNTLIVLLLCDSGLRRNELAGVTQADVGQDQRLVFVHRKFERESALPYTNRVALALDRYLRVRDQHRYRHLPRLLIGNQGAMRGHGVADVVEKLAKPAGLPHIHPHQLRHTWRTSCGGTAWVARN
jgi:integrase/recombinase XerC